MQLGEVLSEDGLHTFCACGAHQIMVGKAIGQQGFHAAQIFPVVERARVFQKFQQGCFVIAFQADLAGRAVVVVDEEIDDA